jgi:hypothetical protein
MSLGSVRGQIIRDTWKPRLVANWLEGPYWRGDLGTTVQLFTSFQHFCFGSAAWPPEPSTDRSLLHSRQHLECRTGAVIRRRMIRLLCPFQTTLNIT